MVNNYEVAAVVEVGKAHDVILGSTKGPLIDDSPFQEYRVVDEQDDE